MTEYLLPVAIEKDRHGYYAECRALQGCYTQGDTYEEVLHNLRDAIKLHLDDRLATGELVETPEMVSVAQLEVTA